MRAASVVAGAMALAALTAACGQAPPVAAPPPATPFVVPTSPSAPGTSPSAVGDAAGSKQPARSWSDRSGRGSVVDFTPAPTRIDLPSIGVSAPIVPVSVEPDGQLQVPDSVRTVGWWRRGAAPADTEGTVVLDVHRDTRAEGRGPFAQAERLRRGDGVTVTDDEGVEHRYRVTSVEVFRKVALPYEELFTQDGPARMVLVTCGGVYRASQGGWDSNVVVVFEPTD
jgi:sortase (surface protein transpeptidase)